MKPLYLKMQAFGPYKNLTEIDFSKFDNGIYVITGDTGAGKTFIFDAISYALFGFATGESRKSKDSNQFVSKYAENGTESFVELYFENAGKQYIVKRYPAQVYQKQNGSGAKKNQDGEKATLVENGTVLASNQKKVNEKIIEIIGISHDQYKKIAMIAQGEFKELIEAKTDVRGEIFRKLFETEKYNQLMQALAKDARDVEAKNKDANSRANSQIKQLLIPDNIPEKFELEKLKKDGVKSLTDAIQTVTNVIEFDNGYKESYSHEEAKLDEEIQKVNSNINDLNEKKRLSISLEENTKTLHELEDTIANLEECKKTVQIKMNDAESLKEKLTIIQNQLPKYNDYDVKTFELVEDNTSLSKCVEKKSQFSEQLDSIMIEIESTNKLIENNSMGKDADVEIQKIENAVTELNNVLSSYKEIENINKTIQNEKIALSSLKETINTQTASKDNEANKIKKFTDELEALNAEYFSYSDVDARIVELKTSVNDIDAILDNLKTYEKLSDDLAVKQSDYIRANHIYEVAANDYREVNQKYLANQAGILAQGLNDGMSCPVCGSTKHLRLANLLDGAPTKEMVERHRNNEIACSNNLSALSESCNYLISAVEDKKNEIIDGAAIHGVIYTSGDFMTTISTGLDIAKNNITTQINDLLQKQARKNTLFDKNIPTIKKTIDLANKNLEVVSNDLALSINESAKFAGKIKSLTDTFEEKLNNKGITFNELNMKIAECNNNISAKMGEKKALQELRELYVELSNKHAQLEERIQIIKEKLNQIEINIASLTSAINSKKEIIAQLKMELEYDSISIANNEITMLKVKIEQIQNEHDFIIGQYNTAITNKSNVLGKLESIKNSIDTKDDFDEILEYENLSKYTKERNEIRLKIEELSGRITANLNIRNALNAINSEIGTLEAEYNLKKSLAETANGQVPEKMRISLETYVQQIYFKRMVQYANVRLRKMTDNQYELRISNESNGTTQVGLDLDVIDYVNGTIREVKSLSGGEKFVSSLALALGMADEVQSRSGGVRIDSIFIDEGFGTLDSRYLNSALNTLNELSGGNKMVGIISHITEVEDRIDKKIIVTKTKASGSEVKIVAD